MRTFFAFWPMLLVCRLAVSQTPGYLHYDIEDGLPSNLIYCMVQDKEGYHWLGTDKGLVRFDGENFKVYDTGDGLPDSEVLNLYEDFNGRLWIGCFSSKIAYRSGGKFFTDKQDSALKNIQLPLNRMDFFEDDDRTLWIAGGKVSKVEANGAVRPMDNIWCDAVRRIGPILFGIEGTFISLIDTFYKPRQIYPLGDKDWARSNTVNGNRLMLAFSEGTKLLEISGDQIRQVAGNSMVFQTVYTDRQNRFWACSPSIGAVCFNNTRRDFSNPVWYLPGRKVNNVYEDRQGNFWFFTLGEGVFQLPRTQAVSWGKAEGLPSSSFHSLATAYDGSVLAGDDLGNVHRFSGGRQTEVYHFGTFTGANVVRQILPAGERRLWVVTDGGFYYLNPDSIKLFDRWSNKPYSDRVGAPKSLVASGGAYWFGSSEGIAVLSRGQEQPGFYRYGRVTVLAADDEGYVWKGGIDGLYSQQDSFSINWGDQFPMLKSRVAAIKSSNRGHLWVVTAESGLLDVRIEGGKVRSVESLNQRLGRAIKEIKNLRPSPGGGIWLATNQGAFFIDKAWNISRFTVRHGLASNEVNDILLVHDTLWAATAGGLSVLALSNRVTPLNFRTVLTDFRYQTEDKDVQIDFSGRSQPAPCIVLPRNARLPEAVFAGLNRSPGDVIHFRHVRREKLLPFPYYTFDNLFSLAFGMLSIGRIVDTLTLHSPFFNLGASPSPGRYDILTTALTFDGRDASPVAWELIVRPHWLQTIWPWLLIFLLGGGSLWYLFRMRTRYLQMETSLSKLKLQAIRAQINPHFVGNSINAIQKFFYPPDPEKASEYIHLFTVLLRKTLLLSEKDFIPFSEEIDFVGEYLKMVQLRYGSQFEYEIAGVADIPPELPFPAMVLQPVLENATIHGLATKGVSVLKLRFFLEERRLVCTVTDNGAGIEESKSRKRDNPPGRISKGIELLENKIRMLNNLHHIDMQMEWIDQKAKSGSDARGTLVKASFNPYQLNPA